MRFTVFYRLTTITLLTIIQVFPLSASGMAEQANAAENECLSVFVTIPPQKYFVQRIGGDSVKVTSLMGEGSDPHTFEITPRQIMDLSQADIYLSVGINFEEAFIDAITRSLPSLSVVNTAEGVPLLQMEGDSDEVHDGGRDPHIWLSPKLVKIQAETIRNVLENLKPELKDVFEANYKNFVRDLDSLDQEITEKLKGLEGKTFLVYHPSFGYFANAYGLNQIAVETGGKEPTPRQLERIIGVALKGDIHVVFVQPQFNRAAAEKIAGAIHGVVKPINHLAGDWFQNMKEITNAIKGGLEG